jgi:hypothetical protein
MTLGDVLSRLGGVRPSMHGSAPGWMARCPAHDDHVPSLSVAPGRREGYVLLYCHAGCEREAILRALGLPEEPAGPWRAPEEPEPGTPAWWAAVRWGAIRLGKQQRWAQRDVRIMSACADLHRAMLRVIEELQRAAATLGPTHPATWDLLERATYLDSERRILVQAMEAYHS